MDYKETKQYLIEIRKYGSVLGLQTIKELLEIIGNPQDKLKIVHIAGTNGKGSVFTFVQSILRDAGYNVGRYSSPAVFSEREIIQFNQKEISKEALARFVTTVKNACDIMTAQGKNHPTSFEVETAAAFLYFEHMHCDIALIETGMGGETDATNVAKKVLCSVISSISLDHTQFLGDTITKIAKVKCGIIKDGCPVVASRQKEEVYDVISHEAQKHNSKLTIAKEPAFVEISEEKTKFCYISGCNEEYHLCMQMIGKFQLDNAVTAIETAEVLAKEGFQIKKNNIENGIKNAKWPGRMEIVSRKPLIVIDGAHNPDAVVRLKETVQMYFTNKRIAFIMGVLADKDYEQEAEILSEVAAKIYTVTPNNARALDGKKLAHTVKKFNNNVEALETVEEAVIHAVNLCREKEADMVLAFGSLSYLGELKKVILNANS